MTGMLAGKTILPGSVTSEGGCDEARNNEQQTGLSSHLISRWETRHRDGIHDRRQGA